MSLASVPSAPRASAIAWRFATVAKVVTETPTARTLFLDVPGWPGHRAGQHVDVRLTAEDGYQAERSYSWWPGGSGIVPLMAMLRHRAAALATADMRARHRVPARLLYSSRRWEDAFYRDELARLVQDDEALEVAFTFTREPPEGWTGFRRRIDRMMLAEVAWPPSERPRVFVCGPTPLVEAVAAALVDLGHDPALVKTERFGPTGSA